MNGEEKTIWKQKGCDRMGHKDDVLMDKKVSLLGKMHR